MDSGLLSSIQAAIESNNIKDQALAEKLGIEVKELEYFLTQFNLFLIISNEKMPGGYTNMFQRKNIYNLELKSPSHNGNTFIKAVVTFINEKTADRVKYKLQMLSEEDISRNLQIIKQLKRGKEYKYDITGNEDLPFEKYLELFTFVKDYANREFFVPFFKKVIEKSIEIDNMFYINLDKFENLDMIINYCKKYPNKIKRMYCFDKTEDDKIKQIVDLNSESLIELPNHRIDLYTSCKNIEILNINSQDLPENVTTCGFNFEKVKKLKTIKIMDCEDEAEAEKLLEFINKCPNLECIYFSTFSSLQPEFFFSFFPKIASRKIKRIYSEINCFEEEDYDYDPIFERFPHLEKLILEAHNSMNFCYTIKPIFQNEGNNLSLPNIEKLITNYINSKPYHYIRLEFGGEYQELKDFIKSKPHFMNKILSAQDPSFPFSDYNIVRNTINKNENLAKTERIEVEGESINLDELKDYVNNVKADFVFMEKTTINDEELLNGCPEVKMVFNGTKHRYSIRSNNKIKVLELLG